MFEGRGIQWTAGTSFQPKSFRNFSQQTFTSYFRTVSSVLCVYVHVWHKSSADQVLLIFLSPVLKILTSSTIVVLYRGMASCRPEKLQMPVDLQQILTDYTAPANTFLLAVGVKLCSISVIYFMVPHLEVFPQEPRGSYSLR